MVYALTDCTQTRFMAYYMCLYTRTASQIVAQLLCFHTITTGRTVYYYIRHPARKSRMWRHITF